MPSNSAKAKSFLNPAVRLSNYFMPTLKETPADAHIVSHRLMLRAGMLRQAAAGIYSWLPLGYRVLKKIEQVVREEQDLANSHELLMPTIQPAELWQKSGRYEDYGQEMLRLTDRHQHPLLYGPTNEELITSIFGDSALSYRDLPRLVYHIQWKFRDEMRPRFGIMRGREFYMKDGYSFDLCAVSGQHAYRKMFVAYLRTFARLGLKVIPMRADTGPIGGDSSHEFIILADTGESNVYLDKDMLDLNLLENDPDYNRDLTPIMDRWTQYFAVTDEQYDSDPSLFEKRVAADKRMTTKGIEVGHIFFFGDKYSKPMRAFVTNREGKQVPLHSGSYGIGVSRLVGAIIEACHDERGIVWPSAATPFDIGLINLHADDKRSLEVCEDLFTQLLHSGCEVMYDDRVGVRAGAKLFDFDLIGLPWQIIVGKRGLSDGVVEVKQRSSGAVVKLSVSAAVNKFSQLSRV